MKNLLYNKKIQNILCVVLSVATVIGLCLPGAALRTASPQNPIGEEVHEINTLLLGNEEQSQSEQTSQGSKGESLENGEEGSEGGDDGTSGDGENGSANSKPDEEPSDEEQSEELESGEQTEESSSEEQGTGEGQEGQEDGNVGADGIDISQLDIAMVMEWYRYGNERKTIVCGPSDAVSKQINVAQLVDAQLEYAFFAAGEDADNIKIIGISVKAGDGRYKKILEDGSIFIDLPDVNSQRDYTFLVDAVYKTKNDKGESLEEEITFTYVLHCGYSLDLEMALKWQKSDGTVSSVSCAANRSAARTIQSHDLLDRTLQYTPTLTGTLADNAKIVRAEYSTASGQKGSLEKNGGSLVLQTAEGSQQETYYFTFEVKYGEGSHTVFYHFTIEYVETLDLQLSFTWLERGTTPRLLVCQPDSSVSTSVKNNQLSAGALKYELALSGKDSENARILNVSYVSDGAGGGKLSESGAIPFILPEGHSSNTYTVQVLALVGGKQIKFEVLLRYTSDVSLEMTYAINENGSNAQRSIVCENRKTKTAEEIYDDQLTDGMLSYSFSIVGEDAAGIMIKSVSCYQSGSGNNSSLEVTDSIQLLLNGGKVGENTFTVLAEDESGSEYQFKINIPYKHRGANTIKINTNMVDGQVVTNETETNLSVNAWSEDAQGNVVNNIPANGTDTKLIVKLDGEQLDYVSSSGASSEYILYPSNPPLGDTNTHTLYIYAEDALGNYGELTLNLQGQRNQAGQKKGTATIYIDMTVLGLGVVDSVEYEVLADEPISYVVAKAILGMNTGDVFGSMDNPLGWNGRYAGTLDDGFYLQSLSPGLSGDALEGSSWNQYGSTEEEVLQAIDDRFGRGSGLATLWRCIYRNGLNKSGGSDGSYGEFDFSSGSGWLFSLDGSYYPGQSMSDYKLEDGDVLTLRYTLAYGWDIGGGTGGYGNTAGYCVTAVNGSFDIHHQMMESNGTYVCRCCGLSESCAHTSAKYIDAGNGTHVKFCESCQTYMGDYADHTWEAGEDKHICSVCGAEEAHNWKEVEGSNTATCTAAGVVTVSCIHCGTTAEQESPANGHKLDERWNHSATEHYQKCSVCGEIIEESVGAHSYEYDSADDDWYCSFCGAGHDWDYCGNGKLQISDATCTEIHYYCPDCGIELHAKGEFPEHHNFEDGVCTYCGGADPDYVVPGEPPVNPDDEPDDPDDPETDPEELPGDDTQEGEEETGNQEDIPTENGGNTEE